MTIREYGLTAVEKEKLRTARKYFNLPESPTDSKPAIVGILIINKNEEIPILSGKHGGPWGGTHRGGIPRGPGSGFNRFTLTHIEGHAAAIMHNNEYSYGVLLIEKEPCGACDPSIPQILPANSRLDVVYPNETSTYWSSQRPSGSLTGQPPSRGTSI